MVGLGEEDFASLPPELIQKYTEQFKTPERFMQINGNIVVLPVPAEKQDLAYLPDRFETGERAVSYTHLDVYKRQSHVGVYVGGGKMLHCGDPIQYADINTSYWQSHFYAFGRPPYN